MRYLLYFSRVLLIVGSTSSFNVLAQVAFSDYDLDGDFFANDYELNNGFDPLDANSKPALAVFEPQKYSPLNDEFTLVSLSEQRDAHSGMIVEWVNPTANGFIITGQLRPDDYNGQFVGRLNQNGELDSSFGNSGFIYALEPGGVAPKSRAAAVELSDGSIIWLRGDGIVQKLLADGSVDQNFTGSKWARAADHGQDPSVAAVYLPKNSSFKRHWGMLQVGGNGKIKVLSCRNATTAPQGEASCNLSWFMLNADGSIDASMAKKGILDLGLDLKANILDPVSGRYPNAVQYTVNNLPSGGMILAVRSAELYPHGGRPAGLWPARTTLYKLKASGVLDTSVAPHSFNANRPAGTERNQWMNDVAEASDGSIFVIDYHIGLDGRAEEVLTKLNASLQPDLSFNQGSGELVLQALPAGSSISVSRFATDSAITANAGIGVIVGGYAPSGGNQSPSSLHNYSWSGELVTVIALPSAPVTFENNFQPTENFGNLQMAGGIVLGGVKDDQSAFAFTYIGMLDSDNGGSADINEMDTDFDSDGLPDGIDTDDDNDGISDFFENSHSFLNPLNGTDAVLDQDGDGFSNLIEFFKGSDPTDINSKPYVAGDFNGNGDAEIFWQAGSELSLRLLDDAVANSLLSTQLSSSWKVRARGDFNGDSKTDILWQHKNGLTRVWLMDGADVMSSEDVQPMSSSWKVIGSGDFDGDKKSDLVWYQASSRTVRIWLMDGTNITSIENLAKKGASGYLPKFVDDFNGDGRADIAWHKASTGHTRFWFMDGATITEDTFSSVKQGTSFSLKGSGDFNADGKADLLWCHKDGRTRLWLLDGAEVTASPYTGMAKSLSWKIQQVGDFDGDGSSDLLWVHKKKPALVHIWHLNSGNVIATDLDADGLTSAQELALGSSDSQQDSDGDGYLDSYEVGVAALNPAVDDRAEDTDSDGLSNIEELLLGSNYNDNDSDSDGVEDGYEMANGLDLLVDDAAGDLDGDGLSNEVEAGLGTRADLADTDGDGLSDSEEVTATTNPLLADTDTDGMFDGYELDYGFDPLLAGEQHLDADSDGFSNLIEFFKGSNPTDINSIPYVIDDFDGDGDAEIFWKVGTTTSIGLLHAVHNIPETSIQLSRSWKPLSRGDYNGDGKADVLWRHKNGSTRVWTMDYADVIASADTNLKLSNSWQPVGSGDVNGDGRSDIIWYHASSRSVRIWQMNGAVATSINASKKAAGGYLVKAIADVDGNGRDDIVWHKASTGQVRIWSMDDGDVTADTFTSLKQSTSFSLKGAGDFNADGNVDLLWRHKDGRVRLWLLDGEEVVEAPFTDMSKPASWKIRSVADYNGDRYADILWTKSGKSQIWYMHDASVIETDLDADGLTSAEELAAGSSDQQADSDGDGWLDSYEVFTSALNPVVDDRVTDTDSDGLSNIEEHSLGLNYNDPDSDGDGIDDGFEVAHELDPDSDDSAADPDSDNLSNLEEFVAGTNPNVADTDADGLTDDLELLNNSDPLLGDTDSDGMGDEFEWFYGLDPQINDSLADNDTDGHSNIKEYYKGSAPNDANSQPYVAGDLDADGDAEVIEVDGLGLKLWSFDNDFNAYDAGGAVNESADWQLQGWNDFNGDKKADVVWRHKKTGALRIWMMDGSAVLSSNDVVTVKSQGWRFEGMGDFDADGIADILWRHKKNGKIQLWDMWGASVQQQLNLSVSPSMDYKFEGIGDFNGDFSDDLLLRHKDARTFVWYLNGSKVTAKRQTSHKLANSRTVEAVADFNGDGKADILWRHVYALSIWEMDGHSRQRTVQIGAQAHKNELRLDALGDYNGDGHLDMLWRGRSGFVLAHPHNAFMVYLDGHGDLAR